MTANHAAISFVFSSHNNKYRTARSTMMDPKRRPTMRRPLIIALMTMVSFSPLIGLVEATEESSEAVYGVDVSFPIHHMDISNNYPWLPHNTNPESNPVPNEYKDKALQPLGDKQDMYNKFLSGCVDHYGKKGHICRSTEVERVAMSLRQPRSMQNYTDVGFKKIRAPEALYKMVKDFWDKNKDTQSDENWPKGNTYTNHWVAPTYMVNVEDRSLRGGGGALKQKLWDAAHSVLEEWTGEELEQCSLYGIRVYTEGAMLATHVDRLPLVSSAIINVAQDLDEPWPIEVYGHDGKATNVTMMPGDMVLYESHSVLHGMLV
jgi:prolyl 4-hydroxylase